MKYIRKIYPEYEGNWNFYFTNISQEDCSIRTDLNLIKIAPIEEFPIKVIVKIIMNKFDRDGSESSDLDIVNKIEEEIHQIFYEKFNCVKTGVITFSDHIDHIYYFTKEENIIEILDPIFEKYHREYQSIEKEDKEWETYRKILYPDKIELHEIYNREAVQHLLEQGDDGTNKRPVDFFVYFKTKEDQEKYEENLKQIVNGEFKIVRRMEDLKEKTYPYEIKFTRNMSLTLTNMDNINLVTAILIEIAEDLNVFFDGWETIVSRQGKKQNKQAKNYFIKDIRQILKNWEEPEVCIASDRILIDGMKVGYCYRQKPDNETDSGWRFFAGDEDIQYAKDASNFGMYKLNTICNYDQDIIPILNSEYNIAYEKDKSGQFARVRFDTEN